MSLTKVNDVTIVAQLIVCAALAHDAHGTGEVGCLWTWFLIFDFYGFFLIAVTRAGGDPRAIQDRLGHRVLSQHTERYTELAPMQKDIWRGKRVAGGHQRRRS